MSNRPAPVRDRLLHLLKQHHREAGMTTVELSELMGKSTVAMNAALSRLRVYGYVQRVSPQGGQHPHELARWKLAK